MDKKERKLFMARIRPMQTQLRKLHKKFGADFLYAMRKYLKDEQAETSRMKEISKLTAELAELHRKR